MKTIEKKVETGDLNSNRKSKREVSIGLVSLSILTLWILSTNVTFAHCDTMDGPLIADARKAMSQNNLNYALKWVSAANESEIRDAFSLVMKVKGLSNEAKELSEKYFFDTLVRIHRAGEGVPFTGVKPSGTPIDEKVLSADKSIEAGREYIEAYVQFFKFAEGEEAHNDGHAGAASYSGHKH